MIFLSDLFATDSPQLAQTSIISLYSDKKGLLLFCKIIVKCLLFIDICANIIIKVIYYIIKYGGYIMKKLLKVFGVILGVFMLAFVVMFIRMGSAINDLEYHEVNLDEIEDGVYEGKAETPLVKVEVQVEVKNKKVTRIDLIEHQNGLGSDAEIIIQDMIEQNTYDVDAISGATASSEVIKSAVSHALKKGNTY